MFIHAIIHVHVYYCHFDCVIDQGRDEGAVIEDWEDPDLSLYKSTDRYGFMQ